jgi:hypothetical protein
MLDGFNYGVSTQFGVNDLCSASATTSSCVALCGAPVPTPLLCPTLLCSSFPPPRKLLSFLTWGLLVSQTARHSRPGFHRKHFFLALGLEILFCFFWLWKPVKSRLASRELHWERIFVSFWGIFWYCIIVIIIIINSFSLSCCCSLNYYCLELFVSIWYAHHFPDPLMAW